MKKGWKRWGIVTKGGRLVDIRSTKKLAQQLARGIAGEHRVIRLSIKALTW